MSALAHSAFGGTSSTAGQRPREWVSIGYVLLFAGMAAYGLAHHEMWRDEMEAWLVARDTRGVSQLIEALRYEQQFLWIILLKPLVRFGYGPDAMQVAHWAFAVANAYLIARYSPFSLSVRGGLMFSYFFAYEYAVISRLYSVGVLLLLLSCVVLSHARKRMWLWLGVLAFLMAHLIVHFWVLAGCLLSAAFVECVFVNREDRQRRGWLMIGLVVAAVGFASPFLVFPLPADSNIRVLEEPWTWEKGRQAFAFAMTAYLPIQTPWLPFWDVNWPAQSVVFDAVRRDLAAALMIGFGLSFLRRPAVFFFYSAATAALMTIFVGFYPGGLRHHGLLIVVLVIAIWLEHVFGEAAVGRTLNKLADLGGRIRAVAFPLVVAGQLIGSTVAFYMDAKFPFSPAKATAKLLEDRGLDRLPIVADPPYIVQTVLGYLPRSRQAYYPAIGRTGSFPRWSRNQTRPLTGDDFIDAARKQGGEEVVILLGYPFTGDEFHGRGVEHLARLPISMAMQEQYDVYLWHNPTGPRHDPQTPCD